MFSTSSYLGSPVRAVRLQPILQMWRLRLREVLLPARGHIADAQLRGESQSGQVFLPLRLLGIDLPAWARALVGFCQYLAPPVCAVIYFPNSAGQRVLGGCDTEPTVDESGRWGLAGGLFCSGGSGGMPVRPRARLSGPSSAHL